MFSLNNAVIPTPRICEQCGDDIKIGTLSKLAYTLNNTACGDMAESAVALIKDKLSELAIACESDNGFDISLSVNPSDSEFADCGKSEAYTINITPDTALITGFDEAGLYYGAVTFTKLVHKIASEVYLPQCRIVDYPQYAQRGHFMECRYGSDFMTLDDWKKGLDYLSEMKVNTVVVGLYGCWNRQYDGDFAEYQYIPFKKYPQLNTPRHIKYYSAKEKKWIHKPNVLPNMYETDYFGDMVAYGKKKNIKVIPLFNSLGHNTLIPRNFPEISAVDENGNLTGVGMCTNNEKTYEIMFDIYDEIIDRYLTPNGIDSFEIGLDEVMDVMGTDPSDYQLTKSPMCKCPKCRDRVYGELMIDYIIRITKYMKSKGINNVYVYHDMLFHYDLLNDKTAELFKKEGVYDNIIIDWWNYQPFKDKFFDGKCDQISKSFRSIGKPITGYYHWCQPMESVDNLLLMRDLAEEKNFEGIVAYSSFDYGYDFNYQLLAECGWNPDAAHSTQTLEKYVCQNFPECYSGALSAILTAHEFMKVDGRNSSMFLFGYYVSSYLVKGVEYPQNFPARQFKAIADDEEKHLTYLRETYHKAKSVYDFFIQNTSSQLGRIWAFSAAIYMLICDEFLTIYTCAKEYNKGTLGEGEFIAELSRLNRLSDEVIALCEEVRFEANRYTIIRNMSVSRQFVCDLHDYMKSEVQKGNKPEVDIFSFDKYLSDASWFLR